MLLIWNVLLLLCTDQLLGYSSSVRINCLSISLARRHHFLRLVNEHGPGVLIRCCQPLSPYCHPSLSTFSSSSPVISTHQSLSVHTQLLIIVLLTCLSKSWIVDLVSLGNLYSSFDMMGFNWLSVLYTNTAVSTTISRLKDITLEGSSIYQGSRSLCNKLSVQPSPNQYLYKLWEFFVVLPSYNGPDDSYLVLVDFK